MALKSEHDIPRKRTMRITIMVRKPLFQNWERRFQMLHLKILCHLQTWTSVSGQKQQTFKWIDLVD